MTCLFKRVLPFTLTLILGVLIWSFLHTSLDFQSEETKTEYKPFHYDAAGLNILSVPVFDFTYEARQTDGFSGTVQFIAAFNEDGTVSPINPALILPDGMTYKEYVSKNHEEPSFAQLNGKAVKNLPYGMTEALINSIEKINFTPAVSNSKPHFVWLVVVGEFNLNRSGDCIRCSSITVTISDVYGSIKWKKKIEVSNAYEPGVDKKLRNQRRRNG